MISRDLWRALECISGASGKRSKQTPVTRSLSLPKLVWDTHWQNQTTPDRSSAQDNDCRIVSASFSHTGYEGKEALRQRIMAFVMLG